MESTHPGLEEESEEESEEEQEEEKEEEEEEEEEESTSDKKFDVNTRLVSILMLSLRPSALIFQTNMFSIMSKLPESSLDGILFSVFSEFS